MAEEDSDPIREGFIRQRRNLIVISLVLLFAETSELSLNKLNVFGNELTIRNPVVVTLALVAAYLYWLYRYYVYFHDLGDKGFGSKLNARLSDLVQRWSKKRFDADSTWRQGIIEEIVAQLAKSQAGNTNLQNLLQSLHDWRLVGTSPISARSFRQIPVQARLGLYGTRNGNESFETEAYWNFVIGGVDAVKLNAWAGQHVLVHTRIFSEYYLPFLIASVPVLYFLYHLLTR